MPDNPVPDTWQRGSLYERFIGRWSRQVAPRFLAWLNCRPGLRWLDVGCGTGALSTALADHCAPALIVGVEPSAGFVQTAQASLAGRVVFSQGTAGALPLAGAAVDGVVSGLVLNFVPDPQAALNEMIRVTRPGGTVGIYLWDYAEKMELIRLFWDSAIALDPSAARLDEATRFPLCRPDALEAFMAAGGLGDVAVTAIDIPTPFASFDDLWTPFLGGQGSAPSYLMTLDETARAGLREDLRRRVPARADGSIALTARAWAVRGTVR